MFNTTNINNILVILFGSLDKYFIAFIVILVIEYIMSITNLFLKSKPKIKDILQPLIKYFYYFLLVIVSHFLDNAMLDGVENIKSGLLLFYISLELIVILNNAKLIGIPVPQKLTKVVDILNTDDHTGKELTNEPKL